MATNKIQQNYMLARANYDTLNAQLSSIMGVPPENEDEIDAYIEHEMTVREQLGNDQAFHTLQQAEQALLTWGHAVAKKQPGYTEDVGKVFETKMIRFRNGVIDLCLKLDARTI